MWLTQVGYFLLHSYRICHYLFYVIGIEIPICEYTLKRFRTKVPLPFPHYATGIPASKANKFPYPFELVPSDYQELLYCRQQLLREPIQVWSGIGSNRRPGRNIVEIQQQLILPNADESLDKLPEVDFLILYGGRERISFIYWWNHKRKRTWIEFASLLKQNNYCDTSRTAKTTNTNFFTFVVYWIHKLYMSFLESMSKRSNYHSINTIWNIFRSLSRFLQVFFGAEWFLLQIHLLTTDCNIVIFPSAYTHPRMTIDDDAWGVHRNSAYTQQSFVMCVKTFDSRGIIYNHGMSWIIENIIIINASFH